MLLKSKLIAGLVLIALVGPFVQIRAENGLPEKDFFLYQGRMEKLANSTPDYKADRLTFLSSIVNVNVTTGKISASKSTPFSFYEEVGAAEYQGKDNFSGIEDFKLEGDYDPLTGIMKGSIQINRTMNYEKTYIDEGKAVSQDENTWITTGSGKFKGQVTGDMALIKLTFTETTSLGQSVNSVRKIIYNLNVPKPKEEPKEDPGCKDSGARFSGVTGQVEVRRDADEESWKLAHLDTRLCVLDHVKTQEDSMAIIGFADMSTGVVNAESEVVITTPPEKVSNIKLVAGNIWVNVKKMLKDGSMEVEMNQAVAGIKGTTLVLEEKGDSSVLKVIEGTVEFTSKTTGEKISVNGGQMAIATSSGIKVDRFDPIAEQDRWQPSEQSIWSTFDQEVNDDEILQQPVPNMENTSTSKDSSNKNSYIYVVLGLVAIVLVGVIYKKFKK